MTTIQAFARPYFGRHDALFGNGRWIMIVVGLFVAFLSLYPVMWLIFGSLYSSHPLEDGYLTFNNYIRAFSNPMLPSTIYNTVVFSVGQTLVAVGIGTVLGWIVARTNTPGRQVFEFLILILFLLPTLLAVVAWTMLLSPSKGLINQALMFVFGLESAPFDIYSLGGMIFVQGLYLAPLAYLIIAPAFASIDASLEESARMSGSSSLQTFRRITMPLVKPAILSSTLLLFVVGLESFDIPQLLGAPQRIFTFTSLIFSSINVFYPPRFGLATALAAALLVVAIICVHFYRKATQQTSRFETIKGKGYRVGTIDIGGWRWVTFAVCSAFFFVTVVLPIAVLFVGSFLDYYGAFDLAVFNRMSTENYARIFRHPQLVEGFFNSMGLAIVGGAICVLLAAVVAIITVKGRMRGRGSLDFIAMLPISFPSTVLGLALLWAWITIPVPVYGTIVILGLAYITRYLPIGLRTVSGGVIQLSSELEEASLMSGASWGYTLRRIILPLIKPTLAAAWLMMFMIFLRELSMSILLAGPGNPVISVVMFDYYTSGELGPLSAASILMVCVTVLVVFIARRFLGIDYTNLRVG